jgi:biofilm PGA synthesis N-glycosyltransferase PgaC
MHFQALKPLLKHESKMNKRYTSVNRKFYIALAIAIGWAGFSIWVASWWLGPLSDSVGFFLAVFLIAFVAIVPGFMNAFIYSSLLLDKRPARQPLSQYPGVSILIAAYNEQDQISQTLHSIEQQGYTGALQVIVINDGSIDATASIVEQAQSSYPNLELINLPKNAGKATALNTGLQQAKYDLVVTLDADSYLYKEALQRLVERMQSDPQTTRAVAGATMVRNSRFNWMTAGQEWEYFHGIATVKRVQSLYQGTLVAQGAFSIYQKSTLVELGGWPHNVGEDIVLTWDMLKRGYRIGYCEDAIAFTTVPTTLYGFVKQRQRWARGMIEAFKAHPKVLLTRRKTTFFIWWDLLFPFMDIAFTFGFIPGLIMAMFGNYWLIGPMTLSLVPLALLINLLMYRTASQMFKDQGLRVRFNVAGFLIYLIPYAFILQPAAVMGYAAEIFGRRKTWGTK